MAAALQVLPRSARALSSPLLLGNPGARLVSSMALAEQARQLFESTVGAVLPGPMIHRAPPQPRQRTLCARALRTWAAVEPGATPRHSGTVSPVQAGPSRPSRRRLRVSGAHRVTLTSPGTPSPPEASANQPQPAPPRALLPGVPASSPPSARGVPLLHPLR